MAAESKAGKSWCLVTSWHPAATLIKKQTDAIPFRAVFTWTSKLIHNWFGFTLLSYTIGLKKPAPLCHPIGSTCKTKTNRHSLAHVFPRIASATCVSLAFWLVERIVSVLCDWARRITLRRSHTMIMLCRPSKQGVEKSSYSKWALKSPSPLKWSSIHSHTFPKTSQKPASEAGYKLTGWKSSR